MLKNAADKLIRESHALAEHIYKQASTAAGQAPGGAAGQEKAPEGDVVDAEYEDPAKK